MFLPEVVGGAGLLRFRLPASFGGLRSGHIEDDLRLFVPRLGNAAEEEVANVGHVRESGVMVSVPGARSILVLRPSLALCPVALKWPSSVSRRSDQASWTKVRRGYARATGRRECLGAGGPRFSRLDRKSKTRTLKKRTYAARCSSDNESVSVTLSVPVIFPRRPTRTLIAHPIRHTRRSRNSTGREASPVKTALQ